MSVALEDLLAHLLDRVAQVMREVGAEGPVTPEAPLAEVLDSMGLVELLALLAEDFGTTPAELEVLVQRRIGSVADLARALHAAGLAPHAQLATATPSGESRPSSGSSDGAPSWLASMSLHLPSAYQPAEVIDQTLHRPPGWLEQHAGIRGRHLWLDEDPLEAAARAARQALANGEASAEEVGALLVTSEAPPLLIGLAAALHDRLDLRRNALALEVGGACTGFLAALHLARALLDEAGVVLIVAVEAPSRYLALCPGPAGETAALFGDAAAACVVSIKPLARSATPLADLALEVDGSAGRLLTLERRATGDLELTMQGTALAARALRVLGQVVRRVTRRQGLVVEGLQGVAAHAGNGRMAALLARQLNLPPDRVWSTTSRTGNLGSASLPAAWTAHRPAQDGPVAWTAVGAGLTWGAALTGVE
jgi:3-oxoacyl-[acyl-carrier-protein] synthase-3